MGFDTDLALFSRRPQVDFEALVTRPVRLYLDDFSNLRIPHFEDFIAVTRSREIWRTILCQTISQLEAVYGEASANTIVGNCSTQLVPGFQDTRAAGYFSERANWPVSTPLDRSWLFVSGVPGELVRPVERSGTRSGAPVRVGAPPCPRVACARVCCLGRGQAVCGRACRSGGRSLRSGG